MTVHIWCPRASDSALQLRDGIRAVGITAYKSAVSTDVQSIDVAADRRFIRRVVPGDVWLNWGPGFCHKEGVISLNGYRNGVQPNKYNQLIELAQGGVLCPEVYDTPGTGRIGRSFKHQSGRDLLNNSGRDYYTQKLPFVRECRIHIFQGKSIHAGLKVPRIPNPHEWIRSYDAGWKIDYTQAHRIKQDRRELAKRAVDTLGLDFGAVDIGIVADGRAVVIEVNTAPGLEGSSVDAYVRQIVRVHNERSVNGNRS
jgi:hypothetical protein